MQKKLICIFISTILLSSCSGEDFDITKGSNTEPKANKSTTTQIAPKEMRRHRPLGAWFKHDAEDKWVQEAAQTVARTVTKGKTGGFSKVEHIERQLVAGYNYRFVLTLEDGQKYYAVVYRNLQGTYAISKLDKIKN